MLYSYRCACQGAAKGHVDLALYSPHLVTLAADADAEISHPVGHAASDKAISAVSVQIREGRRRQEEHEDHQTRECRHIGARWAAIAHKFFACFLTRLTRCLLYGGASVPAGYLPHNLKTYPRAARGSGYATQSLAAPALARSFGGPEVRATRATDFPISITPKLACPRGIYPEQRVAPGTLPRVWLRPLSLARLGAQKCAPHARRTSPSASLRS